MNKRIKELAKDSDLDWHKHWNDDESNRLQKFAESIIKECAKIVGEAELGYDDYRGQIEKGMRDYCQQYLKKTFGVE